MNLLVDLDPIRPEGVFDSSHYGNDAAIRQRADGKLSHQCFHNSCKGRTWADARQIISGAAKLGEFISGHSAGYAPGGNAQNPGKLPPITD